MPTTTLITGANQGLGRETARRLIAEGHEVWMSARDPQAGRAAAAELGGRFVALDVTDDESVAAAVAEVEAGGGLDVLVNNAGIASTSREALQTDLAEMSAVFATNVVGVARVTLAFLPLLRRSSAPVVVNVSSSLGSLGRSTDPDHYESAYGGMDYPASKAALDMLTVKLARALPHMRVNAVNPGYVRTNLNGFQGERSVQDGAQALVQAALIGPDGPTGTFFEDAGPVAW